MDQVIYEKEIPAFMEPYLASAEMQRLKRVDMNCGMNFTSVPLFQGAAPYTRYTHSLGVALIVYHFTKDPVQALAGLFHDIATPAFSHVIDFVHGDALRQESTEDRTYTILDHSQQIKQQLAKDGISLTDIADYHMYPVADNDSPHLSADRLEYTFGAAIDYRFADVEQMQDLYDDIVLDVNEQTEAELVFRHQSAALAFARFALQNGKVFSSREDRCCMEILARIIKKAVKQGVLLEDDLYTDEQCVIQKLKGSFLQKEWQQFQEISSVQCSAEEKEGWIRIAAKKRYIDPYCLASKSRISEAVPQFKEDITAYLAESNSEWMKGIK